LGFTDDVFLILEAEELLPDLEGILRSLRIAETRADLDAAAGEADADRLLPRRRDEREDTLSRVSLILGGFLEVCGDLITLFAVNSDREACESKASKEARLEDSAGTVEKESPPFFASSSSVVWYSSASSLNEVKVGSFFRSLITGFSGELTKEELLIDGLILMKSASLMNKILEIVSFLGSEDGEEIFSSTNSTLTKSFGVDSQLSEEMKTGEEMILSR
jgi:hypothetical protein